MRYATPTHNSLTLEQRERAQRYEQAFQNKLALGMAHGRELSRIETAIKRTWTCTCLACTNGAAYQRREIARTIWPRFGV